VFPSSDGVYQRAAGFPCPAALDGNAACITADGEVSPR
jgi:hypothetical protein